MNRSYLVHLTALLLLLITLGLMILRHVESRQWSAEERQLLASLSLSALPEPPADLSNRYADDPTAATLGRNLFFDTRLSSNGRVACATCHQPERNFTDGLPHSQGVGRTARKSMSVVGAAYSPFLFWDGRKDSLWAQALGPLEDKNEHGLNRTKVAHLVARHYRAGYEKVFGRLPDLSHLPQNAGPLADNKGRARWRAMREPDKRAVTSVFVNVGKAVAAYERQLSPSPSRFDQYLAALERDDRQGMRAALSNTEVAGLALFIGEAGCTTCHSGPLLTNQSFHNTGVPLSSGVPDSGRRAGVERVLADSFNCLSPYSDAPPRACAELRFLKTEGESLERAFKVPSLRNVGIAAPYMHAGQLHALHQVLEHYNSAPAAPSGQSELQPLALSEGELMQLEAFLNALGPKVQRQELSHLERGPAEVR